MKSCVNNLVFDSLAKCFNNLQYACFRDMKQQN